MHHQQALCHTAEVPAAPGGKSFTATQEPGLGPGQTRTVIVTRSRLEPPECGSHHTGMGARREAGIQRGKVHRQ